MSDPVLNQINKKTWDKTKPIMICNVLTFFSQLVLFAYFLFDFSVTLFWIAYLSSMISIIMAVHHAWLLEEDL